MKELLLASASVLALSAGAAFADQVTNINTAYTGVALGNLPITSGAAQADTSQKTPGDLATVNQIGGNNSVNNISTGFGVDQSGDGTSGANSVINQGNSKNASYNAKAQVTQQTSTGGYASSLINQDSGATGSTTSAPNSATVSQIISGGSATSVSTINQSGAGLTAVVSQGATGAGVSNVSSYVGQSGSSATASVTQTTSGAQSVILQNGIGNGKTGPLSNAYVSQTGGTNDFSGIQQGDSSGTATLGTVSVTQSGAGTETSNVNQTGSG